MIVTMVTQTGEEHGLINTMSNHVPDTGFAHINPKIKATLEKKKKDDAKIVKARLISHRGKNERLFKPYCKYAGDPINIYNLIPGYVYDLPMGLIEEVNDTRLPQRSGLLSVDGNPVREDEAPLDKDREGVRMFELVPVNF